MKLNALVVDLSLLGAGRMGLPRARLRDAARPGHRRLHPELDRGPARSRPAARRRRLGRRSRRTPRRSPPASRPSSAGASAASRRPTPARSSPARSRSARTSSRRSSRTAASGLTRREFELLQVLADGQGKVIEREDLYQRVWGYAMAHGDRSVDVFVRKLRAKLQKDSPVVELHPHPLRRRLPLRPGAADGRTPSCRAGSGGPAEADEIAALEAELDSRQRRLSYPSGVVTPPVHILLTGWERGRNRTTCRRRDAVPRQPKS